MKRQSSVVFSIHMSEGRSFRKIGLITIGVIYLLIFIGGVVRATGSGMGCPDWPKCFGMWVPPTSVDQLPPNYQAEFGAKLKGEVEFNATKTWVEYINRLFGALSGLFVFATLLQSLRFLKNDSWVTFWSFIAFLLMGVQGWLGSKVVSTELKPVMITGHMLLAIIIVCILIYAVARSYSGRIYVGNISQSNRLIISFWATMIIAIVQIVLGTQVRESIDIVAKTLGEEKRYEWIENVGKSFIIHRTFSWIVLLSNIILILSIRKQVQQGSFLHNLSKYIILVLVAEIAFGVSLAYLGMTPFAQPWHLTGAIVLVGLHFTGIVLINRKDKNILA